VKERGIHVELVSTLSGKYFLVPLQVHNDAQLFYHSQYNSIEQFIREVINSFATCAPLDTYLVIKHHPMDRGYRDYSNMLQSLADSYKVNGRLYYIHDRHLPTLLKHAKGVVLINSTVGLSALYHDVPLKVCGRAVYDMAGLTFTGTLNDFWQQAQSSRSDRKLFKHFYSYLIHQTQLNCSFY
jgi:capsular polysaccharide export protein